MPQSLEIEGISLLFRIFQGGLFFAFPQDPGFDPYESLLSTPFFQEQKFVGLYFIATGPP